MRETYYAGAYWLGRSETVESYARRAEAFFREIASYDPTWARWFEKAYSREEALKLPFTLEAGALLKFLEEKKYQRDGGGISFAAWNGAQEGDGSSVRFACGSTSPRVPDTCVLTLPSKGLIAERLLSAPMLAQVVRAMALAWEPEWGIATSDTHRDEVLKKAKVGTFVGWIMYFAHHRGAVPPLPVPVHVEPVEDKGTLVILTPERFTASNPEHVALAEQVQEALDKAGLLGPLQPSRASPAS